MEHIYFSVLSSNFEVMFYSLAEDWSDDDIYYVHPMMADIKNVQSNTSVEKHGGDGDTTDSDDIPLARLGKRTKHYMKRKLIENVTNQNMMTF